MLKKYITISAVSALLLVGCQSTTDSKNSSTNTDITVERGPIHGALVLDANGQRASFLGDGKYRFESTPVYPITADGGYIDINRNGQIDEGESELEFSMQSDSGSVITMASTIASNKDLRSLLRSDFDLTDKMIDHQTPKSNKMIAAISDIVYAYCVENNTTPSKLTKDDLKALNKQIRDLVQEYKESNKDISYFEKKMFDKIKKKNHLIKQKKLAKIHQMIESFKNEDKINFKDIPLSDLTDAQKEKIISIAQELKLAQNLYSKIYKQWELKIFRNISKAKSHQIKVIKFLADRYNLELPPTFKDETFEDSSLQEKLDDLLNQALSSEQNALEVAISTEENSIEDLNQTLHSDLPKDLELTYAHLLKADQRHLYIFQKILDRYAEDETSE